ncbi:hypothetical protein FRC10_009661 [Ceratobasidium sp. 414]|nr:hypothetical protein FRC10_009661 [Ceratobasidium sp. 414]
MLASQAILSLTITSLDSPWLASTFYNAFARRNSVYVSTIFAGAFAFSIGFDQATTAFWDNHNKGVSRIVTFLPLLPSERHVVPGKLFQGTPDAQNLLKQWKDIRSKYVEQE